MNNICEGCNCSAITLYTMPDNSRLCDYCSDSWVLETKAASKPVHKTREYNNTKWMIKEKFGTIKKWAELHGFNPGTVNQILNKSGYYNTADIEEMTETHLEVLIILETAGFGPTLIADGYVNNF